MLFSKIKNIRKFLVNTIYASTNQSPYVKSAINEILKQYSKGSFIWAIVTK